MGITVGDLPKAGWIAELLDSILWRLNQFHGRDPFTVQAFFDWQAMWWEIKISDPRYEYGQARKYVMLKVPDEYEQTQPTLRFDDIVDAVKAGLNVDPADRPAVVDVRQYLGGAAGMMHRLGQVSAGATAAAQQFSAAFVPDPKPGEVIKYDGRSYRVLSVSADGKDVQLAPIENTIDPDVQQRERAILEAQEAEALEIMREALRRLA